MRSRISIKGCVRPSVGPSVRWSVRPSVRHTRVEFPRNGLNWNKIASGIRKYAIWNTIQRQVRGQLARTHLLSELCSTCLNPRAYTVLLSVTAGFSIFLTLNIDVEVHSCKGGGGIRFCLGVSMRLTDKTDEQSYTKCYETRVSWLDFFGIKVGFRSRCI